MTFGIILPIATGCWTGPPTNGNNPCYSEHESFPNGHRYAAMVSKSVAGTYNIFIEISYDWGQTWEEEQITFMTGGSATGHQYVGSLCADLVGTGLHVVWYGKGYHTNPHLTYYPSQNYEYSILYKYRDASGVWSAGDCTPYTHDATLSVIDYSGDSQYGVGYPDFRYKNCLYPSMDIDSSGNLHVAYNHWGNWNSAYRTVWYDTYYRKKLSGLGTWGELAVFRYCYGTVPQMLRPNLQVDSYGNPHITSTIQRPRSGWGPDTATTCWFMNPSQGDYTAWPLGVRTSHTYTGVFPLGTYSQLLYATAVSSGTPSYYSRMALSHVYDQGTYDYPHCIYNVSHSGVEQGVFHKYEDGGGWNDVRVNNVWISIYPSIVIGADGMIYTLARSDPTTTYGYRKKATPSDPWSTVEEITCATVRHVQNRVPTIYPWDGQDCSPFMGMVGSQATLFRCGFPTTGSYGYFM